MMKKIYATTALVALTATLTMQAVAQSDTQTLVDTGKKAALSEIDSYLKETAHDLVGGRLKHLEVSVTEDDWKIGGEALAVIGIAESAHNFTFTQLSAARRFERTTVNAGIGYRQFTDDGNGIFGANIFGDSELDTGHQRVGFGLEYLALSGSLHFNHYSRISGEKKIKGVVEKAMSGEDLAYHYTFHDLPYTPSVSVRGFRWRGDDGYKVSGNEMGLGLKLTNQMRLEMFRKDESKSKAESRAQISYVIPFGTGLIGDSDANVGISKDKSYLQQMMYQPVKRQNHIKKTTVNLGIVFTTG